MYILLVQRTLIKLADGCCTKPSMTIFPGKHKGKTFEILQKKY